MDPVIGRIPVPVLGGVNRGCYWSLASAGNGFVSGRRAAPQMALLSRLIRAGDVVWDVGAHHGSVVLIAAPRVGPAGQVHAFEPSEMNRAYLGRHVRWNRLTNVVIHPYALSSFDGEARFGGKGSSTGYALDEGEERVAVRTARSVVASGSAPAPSFTKIDVEDAEVAVLEGAADVLRPDSRLIVSVHSARSYAGCVAILSAAGFEIVESRAIASSIAGTWRGDPDMMCFGPDYADRERDRDVLASAGF